MTYAEFDKNLEQWIERGRRRRRILFLAATSILVALWIWIA